MSRPAPAPERARARVRVTGTVQGVGFRPFVYRLAGELGLAGFVRNDAAGVLIEAEGAPAGLRALVHRLRDDAPPLARVEAVSAEALPARGERGFAIGSSAGGGRADAAVAADAATCPDCLRELRDPGDRRYRYPFINCTACGPRFTIVRGIPYDRPRTTMAGFVMCRACRSEYENPADRRFHAQPNACPACGPALRLLGPVERFADPAAGDPAAVAAAALRAGAIVAVKGLGGYHLACRAEARAAVSALRARKHRAEKPFALMAADLAGARRLVALDDVGAELLQSPARPIVLAPRVPGAPVAAAVAPHTGELGVMLPYTPLHHLLLAEAGGALVMTSGNLSDEPIAYRDEDARARLCGVADLFLVHDRPIETRTDDSVARVVRVGGTTRPMLLRRSRGYVPAGLALPGGPGHRPLLACGAELKSTFCLARDGRAWVSHHIGDLRSAETLAAYVEGVAHLRGLFEVDPVLVAHDLHPDYLSTAYAHALEGVELVAVQHHHAHLAAVLAEHGEEGPAVGAIFDGTGFGSDGTVWGGELLVGGLRDAARAGALAPVPLPGGEAAIREPWRMACAWLAELDGDPALPARLRELVAPRAWRQVAALAASGIASPPTSSVGRLLDAVAALCGIRPAVSYEGQAAIELEAACDPEVRGGYRIEVGERAGRLELDPRGALAGVVADLAAGHPVGTVAARFHTGLAEATVAAMRRLADAHTCATAVLGGGVFANRILLERTTAGLSAAGLRVLVPERLPPGDGAISFGQAAVAAAREAGR
jgi:hydrogenase maturation protein HypF